MESVSYLKIRRTTYWGGFTVHDENGQQIFKCKFISPFALLSRAGWNFIDNEKRNIGSMLEYGDLYKWWYKLDAEESATLSNGDVVYAKHANKKGNYVTHVKVRDQNYRLVRFYEGSFFLKPASVKILKGEEEIGEIMYCPDFGQPWAEIYMTQLIDPTLATAFFLFCEPSTLT